METSHRQSSTIGYMFSMLGLIWGVGVGAVLILVPQAVALSLRVSERSFVIMGLAPQIAAILVMAATSASRVGSVTSPNRIVESVGGFLIEFLTGIFLMVVSLPYVVFAFSIFLLSVVTGRSHWGTYDTLINRLFSSRDGSTKGDE